METTKTNNETFSEGAKVAEKLFSNANAAMTDMYKKQMDLTTGFYNNLFNSGLGKSNGWIPNGSFTNMFSNIDITKLFSNPFLNFSANNLQNPFTTSLDKTMKQMMEFNQNLLSAFTTGINGKGVNWGGMSEEYKETINARIEASKEMLHIISEALNKQLESSAEINKKAMEEINNQFDLVVKQNQKLWADILKIFQAPLNSEEKIIKSPIFTENKKRTNIPVSEFKDHKS